MIKAQEERLMALPKLKNKLETFEDKYYYELTKLAAQHDRDTIETKKAIENHKKRVAECVDWKEQLQQMEIEMEGHKQNKYKWQHLQGLIKEKNVELDGL